MGWDDWGGGRAAQSAAIADIAGIAGIGKAKPLPRRSGDPVIGKAGDRKGKTFTTEDTEDHGGKPSEMGERQNLYHGSN